MALGESTTTKREAALLNAAEEVLARWAIVRVSNGALGGCGLPDALMELDLACDAYEPEECASDN